MKISKPITENSIAEDIEEESYAAYPQLSASKLRSLYLYPPRRAHRDLLKTSFGNKMTFGRLLHLVILEHQKSKDLLYCLPPVEDDNNSKDKQAAKRSEVMAQGKIPVSHSTYHSAQKLRNITLENEVIKEIINTSRKELTLLWHDEKHEIDGKARLDILANDHIYDIKTAANGILPQNFKKSIGRMGYLIQACWYQRAVYYNTGKLLPVSFIVIDPINQAARIHPLTDGDFKTGESQLNNAIKSWKHCIKNKSWPNHFIYK